MTRVLVIGSSHVAAWRGAADRFAAERPDLAVDFFGVRGPLFQGGAVGADGHFTVPLRDDRDRDFVTATNGATSVDTRPHDRLVMVGHRFDFPVVLALLADHDVLERPRTGAPRLIGEALLRDTIEATVVASVGEAARAVAAFDGPVVFAPAPYPARSILERGDDYPLARMLRAFWSRPDADAIAGLWRDRVAAEMQRHGHALLVQPAALCDGPYATPARFAARAAALDGALGITDHRHMNADFGLAMLDAFAQNHLGVAPRPTERIA